MPFFLFAKDLPAKEPTDFDFDATVKDIKRHEGFQQFPSMDVDNSLVVGYGTKLYDPRFVLMSLRMSEGEAEHVMRGKLKMVVEELRQQKFATSAKTGERVPVSFDALTPSTKRGVANMAYNMGVPKLMEFSNTWKSLMAGDLPGARTHARQSNWRRQVGNRALDVTNLFKEGR